MRGLVAIALLGACSGSNGEAAPVVVAQGPSAPSDAGVANAASIDAAGLASTQPCPPSDEPSAPPTDTLTLTKVTFADLPGWKDDKHYGAVVSFLRSCEQLAKLKNDEPIGYDGHGGLVGQWRSACAAAAKLKAGDDAAAKAMFEAEFVPWQAAGTKGPDGKLTGYNVTEVRGSRKKGGAYQTPMLMKPKDLVMVDLAKFIKDSHGRRIWGRLDAKGELQQYFTRKEIRLGALAGKGLEFIYIDDPVDLVFAQIEGSAKAKLDDGTSMWIEFAGKNGRSSAGLGGVLNGMGALKAPYNGTMQGIRAWFKDHADQYNDVMDQIASYVFFAESKVAGALGTQMTILTAERSMAVDRAFIAMSTPIWVDTKVPLPGKTTTVPWRQLLIAQDTGAGITGAVRGDIYWGDDARAAELGGRMGGPGRYWLLLPKGVTK
jgi:membrane-bound lytic murein transglycosylase A